MSRVAARDEQSLLLEREDELDEIEQLVLDAAAGEGRALLIEGASGLGKTRLVDAAAERARAAGFDVLRAAGHELETTLPWG
jgi:MoxR-like ATPase